MMGVALSTAPDSVGYSRRTTHGPQQLPVSVAARAITRFGVFHVHVMDGESCVSDPYGIAWGSGSDVREAVHDWECAAREILTLLSSREVSSLMARRRDVLRHWFG